MNSPTVWIPRDAAALAAGADDVADALAASAAERELPLTLVRNGSRGMFWLEPLVEVVTPAGRVAYGPVTAEDVPGLLDAGMLQGGVGHAAARVSNPVWVVLAWAAVGIPLAWGIYRTGLSVTKFFN